MSAAARRRRPTPTRCWRGSSRRSDYDDLAGCDLVVEAVFENREIKADVTQKTEAVIPKNAVFASNTSTLPITGLAQASKRPAQFIGIHFFSPVDKMPLVEIIVGKKTSDDTLARALDYVAQLRKTPIVVNDSRGFYTSRCFGTFVYEGMAMLQEGVDPQLIENAAKMAGMPVGPLAVADEVTIDLQWKVIKRTEQDLGRKFVKPVAYEVVQKFVEELQAAGPPVRCRLLRLSGRRKKHSGPGSRRSSRAWCSCRSRKPKSACCTSRHSRRRGAWRRAW